jgi:aminopeptidase
MPKNSSKPTAQTSHSTRYTPSQKILARYADVLVNYALNSGAGVKKGEVVQLVVPDVSKALGLELQNAVLRAGAHPITRMIPTGFEKDFFALANQDQLTFFPEDYSRARVKLLDHSISIIADVDPSELSQVDPQKIMDSRNARYPISQWLRDKETQGKFTWTCGLWGVQAKADLVGLSLEEYWQQIMNACFLDQENPVQKWRELQKLQEKIKDQLNELRIDCLKIKGPDIDLTVKLGPNRIWQGGSGRNIPSFELFTSPDWRGSNGWVRFNQPVYRYGNVMSGIELEFRDGLVTKATAKVGQKVLEEMLKTKNASKMGEYSLTDKRMSRITHTMAETLYDENIGGPFGNTHLAIGMAYKDCYRGDASVVAENEWEEMGFNDSAEHTDIISTTDRTVTAVLTDGTEKVIYKDGMFTLD